MDIDGNLKRFAAGKSPFKILTPAEPFHRGYCLMLGLVTLEDGVVSNSNENILTTWKQKNIIIITDFIDDECKYWYINSKQGIIHLFLPHLIINLPEISIFSAVKYCRQKALQSYFRFPNFSLIILHPSSNIYH